MMSKDEVLNCLRAFDARVAHTGSRAICDSVPDTSDDDYVFLMPTCPVKRMGIAMLLIDQGFTAPEQDGDHKASGGPMTIPYKRKEDNLNLIMVPHDLPDHFMRWMIATTEARNNKVGMCSDRKKRVDFFHSILYPEEIDVSTWL
jgi:hypothetical protein